ncbi:DUF1073 domain-containing protein [Cupriavidus sp. amp6]|uniref:phage portal protein n=1 Tax=Cupriavidus sp. amp6 TaxID=388051 RepID=UPI00041CDECB|nr:DUF1073 domain-containing protein [Cupriavidus sp. amp6]
MRLDGYESALLGRRAGVSPTLSRTAVELYALGGLYGRVVDLPADKAVSRGVEIEGDKDSVVANELDRLKVLPALADSLRWSRLTGGAAIVVVANDGGTLRAPLEASRLDTIEELKVFDLDDVSATDQRYSDPTKANFGMPEVYQVRTLASGTVNAEFYVHETRLIPVPGDPLPRRIAAIKGVPWAGRSAITRAYRTISDYSQSLHWSLGILERKQQAIYGMKGLAELLQAQLEDVVQKRIALVDSARNILNTVAIDSEDEYRIEDTNVGGVRDIVNEFQIALSAETGIPVTLLFGRSPAGQNATGDADFGTFYDLVEGLQQNKAGPALERLITLILAQKSIAKTIGQWSIVWPPLESPSEKELADVEKTEADAAQAEATAIGTLIDRNILTEQLAFEYLQSEGRYGLTASSSSPTRGEKEAAPPAEVASSDGGGE